MDVCLISKARGTAETCRAKYETGVNATTALVLAGLIGGSVPVCGKGGVGGGGLLILCQRLMKLGRNLGKRGLNEAYPLDEPGCSHIVLLQLYAHDAFIEQYRLAVMRLPYFLSSTPTPNLIGAVVILLPLLLSILPLDHRIPPFSPRQIIYSCNILPLLLAPLAIPSSFFSIASRLAQAWLITRLPPDAPLSAYSSWMLIGLSRTLEGFVLSRSVGWAYPSLFSHQALYERTGGLGPGVVAYVLVSVTGRSILASSSRLVEDAAVASVCAGLGWADGAPWTYSMAFLFSGAWIVLSKVLERKKGGRRQPQPAYEALPSPQPNSFSHEPLPPSPPPRLRPALLAFIILLTPYALWKAFTPRTDGPGGIFTPPFSVKEAPLYTGPSLEILILTYPRLGDASAKDSILMTTLSSYASLLTGTGTGAGAGNGSHPAFEYAQETYGMSGGPEHELGSRVRFYRDGDEHKGMRTGQHLHVAEAFRWVVERRGSGSEEAEAEWIVLVEDDFPLCGLWGWAALQRVMGVLGRGGRRGGFVGTGGSGLIIHRSLLPALSMVLRAHADLAMPSAVPFGAFRPADLVIQDCLLARDPLCALDAAQQPQYPAWAWAQAPPLGSAWNVNLDLKSGNLKSGGRGEDVDGDGPLVVSSRLIMDHRGARMRATGRESGMYGGQCASSRRESSVGHVICVGSVSTGFLADPVSSELTSL
ncbi:hypothetical protein CONPUDRAFT_146460 [Coniophora puteana RWD-64-598 SS2]|uniref:Uncharacterized protein n=1 Tax=Coniophora puteana (strain RWD-64-598) TaxID=741705 RepID=A0A5M3MC76_CONPW|nr:uncharacterized protein CONPUDRAFT_146460 [Coniophora puteana RWD-64-598 SS2]EIW76636.1 hypothetical protein CONPUDRAFT_146460 [Coniophora puteana RWD-64-598 SS2]